MRDQEKTKDQLIDELQEMRRLISEFEESQMLLKQAEESLKQEAIRRRILVDQSRDGIVVLDQNGNVYEANQKYAQMLGYTMEEVLQLHVWDWDTQFPREQLLKMIGMVDEKGDHFETLHRRKDGTQFDVEISTNGAICGGRKLVFCVCRDITERKRAAEALRESEEKYRTLFEANPDEILIVDTETMRFRYASSSFCEMLGYREEELNNMGVDDIHPKDSLEYIYADFQARVRGETTFTPDIPCLKKDGTVIYVDISGTITDMDGRKCIMGFFRDITQRKMLEEHLRNTSKMEALGTLIGGIAHEFNNVVGIILGNAELSLNDVAASSPVHTKLEQIMKASHRAKDVVKQLLCYIRQTDYEKKLVHLIPVIEDSISFIRSTIPTNILIQHTIKVTDDTVLADPTQVNQIMINLCTNSFHAMEMTGGILNIEMRNVTLKEDSTSPELDVCPGNYVRLTIKDNGAGIQRQILDRIFDPFFSTKETGKGSGMGLTVVKGIITSYGGDISVKSVLGKGTTFDVYFPVVEGETASECDTTKELPTGNERVLFVDDEPYILDIARDMLQLLGYRVETCMTAEEALALFRSESGTFDLVITDMAMPKMAGDILARELLAIDPDIPIILSTGFSDIIHEGNTSEFGIQAFLSKPFDICELAMTVRKALDKAVRKE